MTYKEIINRIRSVAQDHLMIKDFGYGELSDIKTQAQLGPDGNIDDGKEADYPYMFLLQSNAVRNDPVVNYNFSMIMMDMARGEEGDTYDNYLTIQSQCQQYIDDVLANLYYFYRDQPMVQLTGITYQPFKEKYQDEVAGMTANFTIEVPNGLNECVAPFEGLFEWWSEDVQIMGNNAGNPVSTPDAAGNLPPFIAGSTNLIATTSQQYVGTPNWNGTNFIANKTYSKIEITFDMKYTWDPVTFSVANGDPYDQSPPYFWLNPTKINQPNPVFDNNNALLIIAPAPGVGTNPADSIVGWPDPTVITPVVGTTYPVTMTWNNFQATASGSFKQLQGMYNFPANDPNVGFANYIAQYEMKNLNLKLYS